MRIKLDPMTLYGIFFLFFLYAPVLLIPLFSFNDSTVATFPMKGFTLNGYRAMAHDASLMNALKTASSSASGSRWSAPSSACSPPWARRAMCCPARGR